MKLYLESESYSGDVGITPRYFIDKASWIWHPDAAIDQPALVRFYKEFESNGTPLRLHISTDQHYELYIDGHRVSRGPDKSDIRHWSFSSYELPLDKGEHIIDVSAWWIGDHAPMAIMSWRGGFILAAEGYYHEQLTTGVAEWDVSWVHGLEFGPKLENTYHVIGSAQIIRGDDFFATVDNFKKAKVVRGPVLGNNTGVSVRGWRLLPSTLPDQIDRMVNCGLVRAIKDEMFTEDMYIIPKDGEHELISEWQLLISGKKQLTISPHTEISVIWDLENYYCAYPELELSGGKGSVVFWKWAESLYEKGSLSSKGNRNEIMGKVFRGFGDQFIPDGGDSRIFRTIWWRAGRYCLLSVKTADEPLTIKRLALNETRYPLENESCFTCSDELLSDVVDLCVRGMQMCSHDTFMDCPYYEQLMYVGDSRIQMLITYVMTRDVRLVKRGIELFDYSRSDRGFVAERYPSREPQMSTTFALIWPLMVHDFFYWRNDRQWVHDRMIGLRSNLECFEAYINREGLLENLPGWSFVDWVPEWDTGYPPGERDGISSIVNLQYLMALQKAAELESIIGEPIMAQRYREKSERLAEKIIEKFWDDERDLVADEVEHKWFSEHTQCLALLTDILAEDQQRQVLDGLLHSQSLKRTSIYFSFYLLETLYKFGRGDELFERFGFWKDLIAQGLKTPVESPEPVRSDCHAWGSHPLFHFHASIAGIRPSASGFNKVKIAPQPGPLKYLESKLPHPNGYIEVSLNFKEEMCNGIVVLPPEISGEFIWKGETIKLRSGKQKIIT